MQDALSCGSWYFDCACTMPRLYFSSSLLALFLHSSGSLPALAIHGSFHWVRHEVARTVVCYGYIVNRPALPSAASIGTGATGNGRVGSCRDNVPRPQRGGAAREVGSVAASVKAVGVLAGMTRPTDVNCRKYRQTSTSPRCCQARTQMAHSQVVGLQYARQRPHASRPLPVSAWQRNRNRFWPDFSEVERSRAGMQAKLFNVRSWQ